MTFEILLSERASKELGKLPREVQVRVVAKLEEAADDPARHFRRLTGEDVHRLRVGDYRVIADVDAEAERILVHRIGHRRNIYR